MVGDSKGGSWQHAGGMLQPPWLFPQKKESHPLRQPITESMVGDSKGGFWISKPLFGDIPKLVKGLPC